MVTGRHVLNGPNGPIGHLSERRKRLPSPSTAGILHNQVENYISTSLCLRKKRLSMRLACKDKVCRQKGSGPVAVQFRSDYKSLYLLRAVSGPISAVRKTHERRLPPDLRAETRKGPISEERQLARFRRFVPRRSGLNLLLRRVFRESGERGRFRKGGFIGEPRRFRNVFLFFSGRVARHIKISRPDIGYKSFSAKEIQR